MMLSEKVKVSSRFQRSIRIDSDMGNAETVKSFICPHSSTAILINMARGRSQSSEAAFTWTGPYGSGKSSLAVSLGALLGRDQKLRKLAKKNIPQEDVEKILKGFGVSEKKGWSFVPIVGFKGPAEETLRKALIDQFGISKKEGKTAVINLIGNIVEKEECGLFIVIDEMGKFLEAATDGSCDIYFFQQLAELAARSNGKIVLLGILHQAFAEYSRRLTRDLRDEWSKIQGRFVDMPLNVAGEELIEIVGRAIQSDLKPSTTSLVCKTVAEQIANWRPVNARVLAKSLSQCWPVHPVTAALLGPISRRRFGQNQRSVFGFLNSSEPHGFQEFIKSSDSGTSELFSPSRLWNYLKSNLEPSILASPDGHRWSLAVDALSRTEAFGGSPQTLEILKCIALMDMFQERSGLVPEKELLLQCGVPKLSKKLLNETLKQLESWSVLLYKKHKKSYSLYEGSDFDIDAAIEEAYDQAPQLNFDHLRKAASFQPIVAKKHYHQTGALRWMDVDLVPSDQAFERAKDYQPTHGAIGLYMAVLGAEDETEEDLEKLCKKTSKCAKKWPVIVSVAKNSFLIRSYAKEIQTLEWIKTNNPALGGDTVARREVESRLASMRARLEEYLTETLSGAKWYDCGKSLGSLSCKALHELASKKASTLYKSSPCINSELSNRIKPSSGSNSGLKRLLKAMIEQNGKERLNIKGYPAEGGLYDILLANTGLYDGNKFIMPHPEKDPCNIFPMWEAADNYFEEHKDRPISLTEIYDLWREPPYGVKDGLLSFFAVAYIMTKINDYAAYLEGVYRPSIDLLFIEVLMKSPKDIALRQMNFSDVGQKILAGVCNTLNKLHEDAPPLTETSEPLEIARRLVATVIDLPSLVLRTRRLSKNTILLRELIKNANDPNKVLFDDLPHLFKEHEDNLKKGDVQPIIEELEKSLMEMVGAYPILLDDLRQELVDELQVNLNTMLGLEELHMRAKNIMHVSGDFKLDAFAARLSNYTGSQEDIEGIASLAADKPTHDWIDLDVNRAKLRIAELSQQFNHIEAYGRVHNREDFRQAVAFMVGLNGKPKTYVHEFTVKQTQQKDIGKIEDIVRSSLNGHKKANPELLLAALANIGAEIVEANFDKTDEPNQKQVSA